MHQTNLSPNQRAVILEERLISFSVEVIAIAEALPKSPTGQYFCKQLIRSGSAPALLYGEARGAESNKDFRHKMSVALKELRETHINLRIIARTKLLSLNFLSNLLKENNELISIFVAAVRSMDKKLRS